MYLLVATLLFMSVLRLKTLDGFLNLVAFLYFIIFHAHKAMIFFHIIRVHTALCSHLLLLIYEWATMDEVLICR